MLPSRTAGLVSALTEHPPTLKAEKVASTHTVADDAIVICLGLRTPVTKAKKGGFKGLKADNLLAAVLKELLRKVPSVPMEDIGDLVVGNVLQPGGGQAMVRVAMLEAGLPYTIPVASINRQCSSGLQAVATVASHVKCGDYVLGIAGGVESMSTCSFEGARPIVDIGAVKANPVAAACLIPMGITSENIAERYEISRQEQDRYSLKSHKRAAAARSNGAFSAEIVPIGKVEHDEGIRRDTTLQALAALKPAFAKQGTTTAGNSSQLSDGAAAVIVTNGAALKKYNLPALAIWKAYSVVGVPPEVMGIGPAFAIPAVVRKAGLRLEDIDLFEINEAFASQIVFCIKFLGLREDLVNPQGGAISLGHPLGCSGTRLLISAAHYLRANNKQYAVVSLCVGTGMGAAALIENPSFSGRDNKFMSKL